MKTFSAFIGKNNAMRVATLKIKIYLLFASVVLSLVDGHKYGVTNKDLTYYPVITVILVKHCTTPRDPY